MSKLPDRSGPAFPVPDGEAADMGYFGFSKREWFACTILAGMLSGVPGPHLGIEDSAQEACQRADALLAALKEGTAA